LSLFKTDTAILPKKLQETLAVRVFCDELQIKHISSTTYKVTQIEMQMRKHGTCEKGQMEHPSAILLTIHYPRHFKD